jgi:hypothetical protein
MGPYDSDDVEEDEGDQTLGGGNRRFVKKNADHPKRSPIRRKDKWRQEEGSKPKARRNHKKVQNRIKYDWQGD